jgi:hypothetical protein
MQSVHTHGWCVASWQPEIVALAVPLRVHGAWGHVLNVSVSTIEPAVDVAAHLSAPLVVLSRQIVHGLEGLEPADGRPVP